jgi:hypothetical protein
MAKKTKRKGRHDQAQAQPVADAAGNQRASAVSELFSGTDLAGSAPPVSELSFLTAVHTPEGIAKEEGISEVLPGNNCTTPKELATDTLQRSTALLFVLPLVHLGQNGREFGGEFRRRLICFLKLLPDCYSHRPMQA